MESRDLISIVIPAYNRGYCIGRTIESCITQSYGDIEIIVCDDNSTDNTAEAVQKYVLQDSRVRLIRNEAGKGAQYARESGIKAAKGTFIAFMDSDDIMTVTSIEDRYACFLENDVDMVYGDVIVDINGKTTIVHFDNLNEFSIEEKRIYLLEELSLCPFDAIMAKKSLFDDDNIVLDKRLPAWQDDDFVLSVSFFSGKILHCGKPVATMFFSGDNISTHYFNKLQGLETVFSKYMDKIKGLGMYRIFLWKLRILLDAFGVKMQEQEEKKNLFGVFLYKILFHLLRMFLFTQFRHIYG